MKGHGVDQCVCGQERQKSRVRYRLFSRHKDVTCSQSSFQLQAVVTSTSLWAVQELTLTMNIPHFHVTTMRRNNQLRRGYPADWRDSKLYMFVHSDNKWDVVPSICMLRTAGIAGWGPVRIRAWRYLTTHIHGTPHRWASVQPRLSIWRSHWESVISSAASVWRLNLWG